MKSLRLSVLAAALVLGACSSASPTDPAASASRPSFDVGPGMVGSGNGVGTEDGGGMLGTGNGVGTLDTEDGGNTLGSGNGVSTGGGTSASSTTTSDTTQRGGNTLGSGN
jgi:hypothetical protein